MVSDFRRKKLLYLFNKFFDNNNSGTVDKNDFELAADKVAKQRGWSSTDAQYKEMMQSLLGIWEGLQSAADTDKDGHVTADEWVAMWEAYAKNPSTALDWQNQYCKFAFQLEDASGDGSIDSEEFAAVFISFGVDKDEAVAAFQKLSRGKSSISWPEFQELWKEYFVSEDPDAAGNFIFAKSSF